MSAGMIPTEWADLPGEFTIDRSDTHADWFTRDLAVVRVTHRISPTMRIGAMTPVARATLDAVPNVQDHLMLSMDCWFRPWLYPRQTPWPGFDPFPRWTRFRAAARRLTQRGAWQRDD